VSKLRQPEHIELALEHSMISLATVQFDQYFVVRLSKFYTAPQN